MFKRLSVIAIMLISIVVSGCGKEVKEEKVEKEAEK